MIRTHETEPRRASFVARWSRRLAVGVLAPAAALAATGAAYQSLGEKADRRHAPPPGRMVQVDGHQMHLWCTGEGAPTVVLEAGATGFAQTWAWIQPELARGTRVCSYDRAGMGWSDSWETEHDGVATARRLRALLHAAHEPGPYVMVGHSMGGPLVRVFADLYPNDVVALGQVDPSHEDQLRRFPAEVRESQEGFHAMIGLASRLAPLGVLRATNLVGRNGAGLPERHYRTARMLASSSTHLRTSHAELMAWDATMDAARRGRSVDSLPVVVVSAAREMDGMPEGFLRVNHAMHAELAARSPRGRHVALEEADHFSLLMERPHALRVAAILRELVEETR